MTTAPDPGAAGTAGLADEALRLVEAARTWAQSAAEHAPVSTGAPECQWCPLCRLIAVLRGERPEISAAIADVGAAVMAALSAHLTPTNGAPSGEPATEAAPTHTPAPAPAPRPTYEPIDLSDGSPSATERS